MRVIYYLKMIANQANPEQCFSYEGYPDINLKPA